LDQVAALLHDSRLFTSLDHSSIERMAKLFSLQRIEKHQMLAACGEPCTRVYIIDSGSVRVFLSAPDGRERVVCIARRGSCISSPWAWTGEPNCMTAEVHEGGLAATIAGSHLQKAGARDASIGSSILRHACWTTALLAEKLTEQCFESVHQRVVRVLLGCVRDIGADAHDVEIHLTHEQIGDLAGTARECATREIHHLAETGAVSIAGYRSIRVLPDVLKRLLEEKPAP